MEKILKFLCDYCGRPSASPRCLICTVNLGSLRPK